MLHLPTGLDVRLLQAKSCSDMNNGLVTFRSGWEKGHLGRNMRRSAALDALEIGDDDVCWALQPEAERAAYQRPKMCAEHAVIVHLAPCCVGKSALPLAMNIRMWQ